MARVSSRERRAVVVAACVLALPSLATVAVAPLASANLVDVQPLGPAGEPDTFLAVSVLADATARNCAANPCFAFTALGSAYATDGVAVSGRDAAEGGGGYAIGGGNADAPKGTALAVGGDANGATAFSVLGHCNGRKCIDVEPTGRANGSLVAIGSGGASSDVVAVSRSNAAQGRYAASIGGPATGEWAASGTGDAYGDDLAASGVGRAVAGSDTSPCRMSIPETNGAPTLPCGVALAVLGPASASGLAAASVLGDAHTGTCYVEDPSQPTCGIAFTVAGDASNGPCWTGSALTNHCGLAAISVLGSASSGGGLPLSVIYVAERLLP
ncbi:MAG: hypothetical protein ACYDCK_05805 [Thermoplasmatota archaeon]